jgi:SAM-dependent methyltransferase/spore coat polysaccharide biosynthesis predicted glycosyltransferase SpsG
MKPGSVLVVPAVEKGRGGGHLIRSLALVRDLQALGRDARLYLSAGAPSGVLPGEGKGLSRFCEGFQDSWLVSGAFPKPGEISWDFIVLDRYKTPEEEFRRWAALAPLIGIDEGGPCRKYFDFLIDLLPGPVRLSRRMKPNRADPSLIPLPQNRRPPQNPGEPNKPGEASPAKTGRGASSPKPLKILISFGAEDPKGLGLRAARVLAAGNDRGEMEINLLAGGLHSQGRKDPPRGAGVRILGALPDLRDRLGEYDLLITHFGLTAFEALYARLPVLLISPGAYHEKLAKKAGFYSAGIGRKGLRRLGTLLLRENSRAGGQKKVNRAFLETLDPEKTAARHGLDKPQGQALADLLGSCSPLVSPVCPGCGYPGEQGTENRARLAVRPRRRKSPPLVLARFPRRSFSLCPACGLVYMNRLDPPPIEYSRDYFFDFYKKQYGKTYIEDFPGLVKTGKERLKRIQSLLRGKKSQPERPGGAGDRPAERPRRLLDIGCAYGPFLAAAREAGFSPAGLDPAEDAVAYIRETLQLEAHRGSFPETRIPALEEDHGFDVVSLWYVIEHFRDPRQALREIGRLLKPGGVLAFSSPSISGISGLKNRAAFLEKSPEDHWTIWSPGICGKILKKSGFKLRKIHVTGHHPERFPLIGGFALPGRPLYGFLLLFSRIFRLGDTFEAYATATGKKNGESSPDKDTICKKG